MKDSQKYGLNDRKSMESDEKQEVVKTGLPETRMDDKVQVTDHKDTVTKASANSSEKEIAPVVATKVKSKMKLAPSAEVKILDEKQVGGVPITSGGNVIRSAAGASNKLSPVADSSRKPYTEGGARPSTRAGKVTSDNDFLINNAISEQIEPEFVGAKDLREAPDALQGYNGQKQFKVARGKKNAGKLPQSTLFERSVDMIKIDQTIHTTGQVLDNIEARAGYPTKTYVPSHLDEDDEEVAGKYEDITNPMPKSNYLLKSLSFTISGGKFSAFAFNEDKIPAHIPDGVANMANLNWQVDSNNVTKTMIKLQTELGRETTDKWSPLGYVIEQPYQYNMLAHDIEATTGAMQALAYRAQSAALAYQANNKLAKDGAKPTTPIVEMFLDGVGQIAASATVACSDIDNLKYVTDGNGTKLVTGEAMISLFDSTGKYKTKASIFNLPRSLKYFLQTADNNIDPLYCKKEFIKAVDCAHVFSTVDGSYSPVLPIYATDKISIVNPLSLNVFLRNWSRDNVSAENPAGTATDYVYAYSDLRNEYIWNLKHPIVDGILSWMIKHEANFAKVFGNGTFTIPCFFSMLAPSFFQEMLCAASYEILYQRNVIFRDYLFAGEQTEYIWKDLSSLKILNPKYSSNLGLLDYKTPLKLGKLSKASAIQVLWGENYQVAGADDPVVGTKTMVLFMPWHHVETAYKSSYDTSFGFYKDFDGRENSMAYPEVRQGVNHEYIDMIHELSEREVRLCLDRGIGIPLAVSAKQSPAVATTEYEFTLTASTINDKIKVRAVRYDKNSDGRVIVEYDNAAASTVIPSKAAVMCLPRELGFIYPKFRVSPIISAYSVNSSTGAVTITTVGSYKVSENLNGSLGYTLVSYHAKGGDLDSTSISRTAALQQDFISFFADHSDAVVSLNGSFVDAIGILPSMSTCFKVDEDASDITIGSKSIVNPFYAVNSSVAASDLKNTASVITLAPYLWTMMNRFFMPINPFENCMTAGGTASDFTKQGILIDPLESCFIFGLAGFFASEFSQDVLDRADKYDQLNIDYTEDEFIKSSLIFRE